MNTIEITDALATLANEEGFSNVGFCPAVEPAGLSRFREWLVRGYAGSMDYLENRAAAYQHPQYVLEGARSLVMLTFDYRTEESEEPPIGCGRVSRYAWGSRVH